MQPSVDKVPHVCVVFDGGRAAEGEQHFRHYVPAEFVGVDDLRVPQGSDVEGLRVLLSAALIVVADHVVPDVFF